MVFFNTKVFMEMYNNSIISFLSFYEQNFYSGISNARSLPFGS